MFGLLAVTTCTDCLFRTVGPPIVTPFLYTSYAEQHRDEVMTIFNYLQSSGVKVPVLLGDFNSGPASPGLDTHKLPPSLPPSLSPSPPPSLSHAHTHYTVSIFPSGIEVAEFPFYYGLFNIRGFVSPYVLKDGRCTFCPENPFVLGLANSIVDHIYITTDTTERVLVAKVLVTKVV